MLLLEYDRGITSLYEYRRKLSVYLDYKPATGKELPLLVVTVSLWALTLMRNLLTSNKVGFVPRIVKGRPVKSANHYNNKLRAKLQSKLKGNCNASNQLERLTHCHL